MSSEGLKESLRDVAFTTATPFSADAERVDHEALAANLDSMYEAGARLFIPCGNTGEYYALSTDERAAVVRTHVERLPDDATVIGGAGGNTKDARELIARYEEAGADAVMVMSPSHTFMHERGLVEYYRRLAEATDLGVVVYKRGPELTHPVLCELSTIDTVVAVKYATADVNGFRRAVADGSDDVVWLNGIAERYALAFAIEGADGYTTGIGNFAPGATLALFDAIEAREWDRARSLQRPISAFEEIRAEAGTGNSIAAANNVPAVKRGLELAGLNGGPVREPLAGLSEEDQQRVDRAYERLRDAAPDGS